MTSVLCKVIQNNGINPNNNLGEIKVQNTKGSIFTVFLSDMWKDALDYLWLDSTLLLHNYTKSEDNKSVSLDKKGFLVLEPDILVSPSHIRSAEKCIRSYYINRRLSSKPRSYPLLRGSLVNNAFDILIDDVEKTKTNSEIVEKVLNEKLIDISLCPDIPDSNSVRNEIGSHLKNLRVWKTHQKFAESQEISTESTFISRKYGLTGRTDILVDPGENSVTYELKSSKAPTGSSPWKGDIYQVASYQLMLESALDCKNSECYVIYSRGNGNDLLKKSNVDYTVRRDIVNLRNKIVSIDYSLKSETEMLNNRIPKAGMGNTPIKNLCDKCLHKNDCFSICKTLEEKSCSTCNVANICSAGREKLPKEDLDYYNKYFRFTELERNISKTNFARIFGDLEAIKSEGKIIQDLSFIALDNKSLYFKSDIVIESEIKAGDIVLLYSESINRNEVYKATINEINKFDVVLQIKKHVPERVFNTKKWNIYSDTIETSFDAMNGGMYSILSEKRKYLRDLIQGREKPKFGEYKELELSSSLNDKQKKAINKAVSAKDYFLIQGPPGTGKTHTLANLIIEIIKKGQKVLLSAFTHRAIDNVLLKLTEEGFHNFIRIGNHESVDKELHDYLVQEKIEEFNIDQANRVRNLIETMPLIACSSISSVSNAIINHLTFDVSVVDEAGQLTEPGTVAIISQSNKFILVGDHKQLPPVVQNDESKKSGLAKSLFERLIDMNLENRDDVLVTLEEQYRMNTNIMQYSSTNFYNFKLKAFEKIAHQKLDIVKDLSESKYNQILEPENNMIFVDFRGSCVFKVNYDQAKKTIDIIKEFIEFDIKPEKIGVITPFRAQVAEIKRNLFASDINDSSKITVDTVDRFQGSDRDIIIFSSVISNDKSLSDFFTDYRRINVSVTRAKKKFIMIGSKDLLSQSKLFYELIKLSKVIEIV